MTDESEFLHRGEEIASNAYIPSAGEMTMTQGNFSHMTRTIFQDIFEKNCIREGNRNRTNALKRKNQTIKTPANRDNKQKKNPESQQKRKRPREKGKATNKFVTFYPSRTYIKRDNKGPISNENSCRDRRIRKTFLIVIEKNPSINRYRAWCKS